MLRIMLATVCYRFGSWRLVLKLNFCSDFEHKGWSRFWSWSSGLMLSRDSEDEMWFVFELWYDLKKLLWQDELNPRVRCAFGNVFSRTWSQADWNDSSRETRPFKTHSKKLTGISQMFIASKIPKLINFTRKKPRKLRLFWRKKRGVSMETFPRSSLTLNMSRKLL